MVIVSVGTQTMFFSKQGEYNMPQTNHKKNPPLDSLCYMEKAFKEGQRTRRSYPDSGIPKLLRGLKKGVPSPLIAAFGLDKNDE